MVEPYADDPNIDDATQLWRWVRPDVIVPDVKRPSGWRLSSQAFENSQDDTPCSVAIAVETWTAAEVLIRFPDYAIAQISAGDARSLKQRVLRWADPDVPGHAYVAGYKPKGRLRALAERGRWVAGGRNWDSATRID